MAKREAKRGPGRPTTYNDKIANRICTILARGVSLAKACKQKGMPEVSVVFDWLRIHPEFKALYITAKEESADALTEEILDLADDCKKDVNRSRLQVDTRKWIASKMKPKKYGDHIRQEVTGANGGPVIYQKVNTGVPDPLTTKPPKAAGV